MNRQIITTLAWIISVVALTSCSATTKSEVHENTQEKSQAMEVIHGISLIDGTMKISVTSSGCTKKEHFDFVIEESELIEVTITRNKHDGCKRRRQKVDFDYPLSTLGLADISRIHIKNPIVVFKEQRFKNFNGDQ